MLVIVMLVIVMRRWKVLLKLLVVLLVLVAGVLHEGIFLKHTGGIVTEALLIHISYGS